MKIINYVIVNFKLLTASKCAVGWSRLR